MSENLWAPWRITYLTDKDRSDGCIFCNAAKDKPSNKNLVLFKNRSIVVMLNRYPYTNGHIMIAPRRHIGHYEDLTSKENEQIFVSTQKMIKCLKKIADPNGFNVGMNIQEAGGAGFADHLHLHIVPRWNGDVNFMTSVANTRVISEALEETYKKLHNIL